MSNVNNFIRQSRARLEAATPGPLLEHEDLDYYQGGTYLGIGRYTYKDGEKITSSDEYGYFETNVCRVENAGDKEFLKYASHDLALALQMLEIAVASLELIERAYATHGERMAHQNHAAKTLTRMAELAKEKEGLDD